VDERKEETNKNVYLVSLKFKTNNISISQHFNSFPPFSFILNKEEKDSQKEKGGKRKRKKQTKKCLLHPRTISKMVT
jgi:hypothetical protein